MTRSDVHKTVLELGRAGLTMDEIARRTALPDAQRAREVFTEALADATELPTNEAALLLELDRLDRLHVAVWTRALKGNDSAVDHALRISDRRRDIVRELHGEPPARSGVVMGPLPGSA